MFSDTWSLAITPRNPAPSALVFERGLPMSPTNARRSCTPIEFSSAHIEIILCPCGSHSRRKDVTSCGASWFPRAKMLLPPARMPTVFSASKMVLSFSSSVAFASHGSVTPSISSLGSATPNLTEEAPTAPLFSAASLRKEILIHSGLGALGNAPNAIVNSEKPFEPSAFL